MLQQVNNLRAKTNGCWLHGPWSMQFQVYHDERACRVEAVDAHLDRLLSCWQTPATLIEVPSPITNYSGSHFCFELYVVRVRLLEGFHPHSLSWKWILAPYAFPRLSLPSCSRTLHHMRTDSHLLHHLDHPVRLHRQTLLLYGHAFHDSNLLLQHLDHQMRLHRQTVTISLYGRVFPFLFVWGYVRTVHLDYKLRRQGTREMDQRRFIPYVQLFAVSGDEDDNREIPLLRGGHYHKPLIIIVRPL